jgi:anti-sigma factor RsiW
MKPERACEDVRELLEMAAYGLLEDTETAGDRGRLDAHLVHCEACREALAVESAVTESLGAIARVRTSVSVEDRVMATVRVEAARRPKAWRLTRRQKTVLGGAAAIGTLVELALWAAIVIVVLRFSNVAALMSPATVQSLGHDAVVALTASLDVGLTLGRAVFTVVRGLTLLLPPPEILAVLFVSLVSFMTFVAVRRDLRRSPAAARGLR